MKSNDKKKKKLLKKTCKKKKKKTANPGYKIMAGNIYYPRLKIKVPLVSFFKEMPKSDIDRLMNKYYKKHYGRK